MEPLVLQVCSRCGHARFPSRVLCPRCGSPEARLEECAGGLVEEVTVHRRGGTIASVRTDAGPVVIARAPGGTLPGARASLALDGGAPVVSA